MQSPYSSKSGIIGRDMPSLESMAADIRAIRDAQAIFESSLARWMDRQVSRHEHLEDVMTRFLPIALRHQQTDTTLGSPTVMPSSTRTIGEEGSEKKEENCEQRPELQKKLQQEPQEEPRHEAQQPHRHDGERNSHTSSDSRSLRRMSLNQSVAERAVKKCGSRQSQHGFGTGYVASALLRIEQLTSHGLWGVVWSGVVVLNVILVGVEVQHGTNDVFNRIGLVFNALYVVELMFNIAAQRLRFFAASNPNRYWNIFDVLVVTLAITDTIGIQRSDSSSIMRLLRSSRVARVLRVLRFCTPLRTMVLALYESMKSLFWATLLLCGILYVLGIVFTQGAAEFLQNGHPPVDVETQMIETYGSLTKACYWLFSSVAGGVSWTSLVVPLTHMGWGYVALFLAYIAFTYFALLNIITAVVVDTSFRGSQLERECIAEQELLKKEACAAELKAIFCENDDDGNQTLSYQDFLEYTKDERVQAYFSGLRLDTTDTKKLFQCLDKANSGLISIEEFVEGCLEMMGDASRQDIHTMTLESRQMLRTLRHFMRRTERQLEATHSIISVGFGGYGCDVAFGATPTSAHSKGRVSAYSQGRAGAKPVAEPRPESNDFSSSPEVACIGKTLCFEQHGSSHEVSSETCVAIQPGLSLWPTRDQHVGIEAVPLATATWTWPT